jgi:pimeloyl-ACP methyl ester carboxylesterase
VHYVRAGSGAPPLVFVHGFACSHEDWLFQLKKFRTTNETVACDLRGHGLTPGKPQDCSIEHYGGDVAALLANLDLSESILIGHSMGCRVVLEAARLDPDRVAGIVLVDGSRQGTGDPDVAEKNARAVIEATGYAPFATNLFRQMFLEESDLSRAVVARALRFPAENGSALWPRSARWDAARMDEALASIRVPLLVIQSTYLNPERKRLPLAKGQSSPWLDFLRQKIPSAKIEVIPGVGHFPQIEAAETVNRLIAGFVQKA